MKHQYESELIEEIVDARGHKKSSLHYESECMETWIEEAKGAYPKLCDYESEWLKYISILDDTGGSENPEPPIGEFPYVVLSDVTEATIDNVVPYAYKSAILKGDTLVNVVSEQSFGGNNTVYESRFFDSPFNKDEKFTIFVVNPNVTTIRVGLHEAATGNWQREHQYNIDNNKKVVYTVPSGCCCKYVGVVVRTTNNYTGFENSLVIVSGDKSNLEIENYFEGMQSVQMPVLTTTGKNLFNESEKIEGYISANSSKEQLGKDIKNTWTTPWIKAKTNTSYTIQGGNRNRWQMKSRNNVITFMENETITTLSDTEYIRCYYCNETYTASNVQVEESSSATSYESFKSNILTCNEDVTLRSNGNICDELNLLTGQLTQRIDEDGEVLSQEVVKTVDLTITNQDGETLNKLKPFEGTMHLSTSGENISPLFSGEIPVEAITQNLASFIDLD